MRRYYPVIRELLVIGCTVAGIAVGWCAGRHSGVEMGALIGAFTGMSVFGALADIAMKR